VVCFLFLLYSIQKSLAHISHSLHQAYEDVAQEDKTVGPPPVSAQRSSFITPKKTPEPKSVFWEPEELLEVFLEEDDGGCDFDDYKSRNIQNNKNVNLPHLVTRWKDGELREHCTVFLWMLSGLDPNNIHAKVCDGGLKMSISFS
jgi:hypothetical protein